MQVAHALACLFCCTGLMEVRMPESGLTLAEAIELLSSLSPEAFYKIESVIENEIHQSAEQSAADEERVEQ